MIFDKIQNLKDYYSEYPALIKVNDFVELFYKDNLPDGKYDIDGEKLFAFIQSYETKPFDNNSRFEAHKKYIDLQLLISGIEVIKWAKLENVNLTEERYSLGQDIAFYDGSAQFDFVLTSKSFLLFNPEDAHMPGLSYEKNVRARKIVFKILSEGLQSA